MLKTHLLALATVAVLLTACGDGEGGDDGEGGSDALMSPGKDCMACHSFTAAGTVYPSATAAANTGLAGVSVVITDANGATTTLTTNAAGNFYTNAAMARPLRGVYVVRNGNRIDMSGTPTGACSSCHALPPDGNAGRVYVN